MKHNEPLFSIMDLDSFFRGKKIMDIYITNPIFTKMKNLNLSTIFYAAFCMLFLLSTFAMAQNPRPRKSPKASVMQRIGADTDIVISYSRPGVKGRTIWGDLVPYGMYPGNRYSKDQPYPWRAGADENTTIEFNNDVLIEGEKIPAGKYGLHMVASEDEFQIMFNKKNDAWGSFSYNPDDDVLVVKVTPENAEYTEWLEFGFEDLSDTGATAFLQWDELKIPFRIELPE